MMVNPEGIVIDFAPGAVSLPYWAKATTPLRDYVTGLAQSAIRGRLELHPDDPERCMLRWTDNALVLSVLVTHRGAERLEHTPKAHKPWFWLHCANALQAQAAIALFDEVKFQTDVACGNTGCLMEEVQIQNKTAYLPLCS